LALRLLAAVAATGALATPVGYLQSQQQADGGWGSPQMTAWAALALRSAGAETDGAVGYLVEHESQVSTPTEVALVAVAEAALGRDPAPLLSRLPQKPAPAVNAAVWQLFALRQSGRTAPRALVAYLRASQTRSGGFPWARGAAPDSNMTAWAVQALRSAGVTGHPITRAIAYLRTLQAPSGGFGLVPARPPDAQSTALVIQAFVAAESPPPAAAFRFLASLRRADGSYRYSRAYTTTPVWVTAQVVPALFKKPLPLR
jgi:prenyltransferase beta subunit